VFWECDVVASLSIVEQIPKAARGRARTPKVRQLQDKKVPLNASTFQPNHVGACRIRGQDKSKNEIDTLSRILVETTIHFRNRGKIKGREKKNVLKRLRRFNEKHHSAQTRSNEKEIRFPIRIF
jgi:hypothetical protein